MRGTELLISKHLVVDRDKELQDRVFNKMFRIVQMCWWYALYAPEYADWEEKETRKFSDNMVKMNNKLESNSKEFRNAEKKRFSEESGLDFKQLASKVPYKTKTWMYKDKEPKGFENPMAFAFQLNQATQEGVFLAIYTMFYEYKMDKAEILKHFNNFLEVTELFVGRNKKKEKNKGLQGKHIVEYFEKIEGIKVYE